MTVNDLIGHYEIIGTNQDDSGNSYKGELFLSVTGNNSVSAKWLINDIQEQFGEGYLERNLLKLNFYYYGDGGKLFKGKVVYEVITKDILEGKWTEELGDANFLGLENCFRIKNTKTILN